MFFSFNTFIEGNRLAHYISASKPRKCDFKYIYFVRVAYGRLLWPKCEQYETGGNVFLRISASFHSFSLNLARNVRILTFISE